MTRVVISQPMYFPWVGFIAQMALADVFIWLDDAQFSKGSFTNRIQVKLPDGRKWMSVPLEGKGAFQTIRDLHSARKDWIPSHRALLDQSLRGRPHTAMALQLFDEGVGGGTDRLCDQLIASSEGLARHLNVLPRQFLLSSSMGVDGTSWSRVLALVQAVGGTEYITGHGALGYLDHSAFESSGIAVRYMDYQPLPWPQPHGDFTPYITGLDLIASLDAETARTHLRPASMDWRAFRAIKEPST
ncbi:MAG: WbqC family protein [Paracoccaceae bacterium]